MNPHFTLYTLDRKCLLLLCSATLLSQLFRLRCQHHPSGSFHFCNSAGRDVSQYAVGKNSWHNANLSHIVYMCIPTWMIFLEVVLSTLDTLTSSSAQCQNLCVAVRHGTSTTTLAAMTHLHLALKIQTGKMCEQNWHLKNVEGEPRKKVTPNMTAEKV